jgi:hypothetical protein
MKAWRRTTRDSHPEVLPEEITINKNIFRFEAGKRRKGFNPLRGFCNLPGDAPNGCANSKRLKGLESGLDELLKIKGQNKKDVKNASCSG